MAWTITYNGFSVGGTNRIQIINIDGIGDLAEVESTDTNRGWLDGTITGRDFLRSRTITVSLLLLRTGTQAQFKNDLIELRSKWVTRREGVSRMDLTTDTEGDIFVFARLRQRQLNYDVQLSQGKAVIICEFYCPDPQIYLQPVITVIRNPILASFFLTNTSGTPVYPTITLTNCTNPSFIAGPTFTVDIVLSGTDKLVIDFYNRTMLRNGLNVRNLLRANSVWLQIDPGGNTWIFTAAPNTGQAIFTYYKVLI